MTNRTFGDWIRANKGRPVGNLTDDEIVRYANQYGEEQHQAGIGANLMGEYYLVLQTVDDFDDDGIDILESVSLPCALFATLEKAQKYIDANEQSAAEMDIDGDVIDFEIHKMKLGFDYLNSEDDSEVVG